MYTIARESVCCCCCLVAKSRLILCHPMDCSMMAFFVPQSWLRCMSTESVMPSDHLVLCRPLLLCLQSFPASGSFPVSWLFTSGGQTVGASASVWVLPVNIQGWFLVGLTGLIFMQSKGLCFTSLIPKMLMFTLTISCWTMSNLPWFMDLTFQVPIQSCSLQHQSLLSPPDSSTTVPRFCFGESMKNYKFISRYCFNWISKYGDLLSLL